MTTNKKIILFLDTLGRTIIAQQTDKNAKDSTTAKLAVTNPAVLNIIPTQQGTMQVQIIPLVFRELLADKEADSVWNYNRTLITECSEDTHLNTSIIAQYENVTSPTPQQAAPSEQPAPSTETIKLFDED